MRRILLVVGVMLALGVGSLHAQRLMVDTLSTQFSKYPGLADTTIAMVQWHLREVFRFEGWTITLRFRPVVIHGEEYAAATFAMPRYKIAEVEFDLEYFRVVGCEDRMETIRHELFHVQLWQSFKMALELAKNRQAAGVILEELEEQLTTDLERLKIWRRVDGCPRS